ncbi:hypothetical protein GALMADRAFT_221127 [Galerina marginata CBS 339.88]|uniref:Uncharacterized protein n=1 Tax=Galerina marginata (strain CBS 339.88) TaxID=685588 RepID=A0A067TLH3_GALM3|nr:hypothetical protein GALMADRAFT_221127 [Galerina marginata CBS 339.88]
MIGIFCSGIAYGASLAFLLDLFSLLRKTKQSRSKRSHLLLSGFSVGIFLFSTMAVTQGSVYLTLADHHLAEITTSTTFSPWKFLINFGMPVSLPFIVVGANLFMIWRCVALSKGIGTILRLLLFCMLPLLFLSSLVGGILFYLQGVLPHLRSRQEQIPTIPLLTTISNILLGLSLFLLVFNHQKMTTSMFEDAWYTRTANICVDACSLISVISSAHIILSVSTRSGSVITLQMLPHISVMTMTLALERMIKGPMTSKSAKEANFPQNFEMRESRYRTSANSIHLPSL